MAFDFLTLGHGVYETVKISVPAVVGARRGTLTHEESDRLLRKWAKNLLAWARAEVVVVGADVFESHPGPFVVLSNHQSIYDIPILFASLPLSLRMAAKKELFKTPLWGSAMRAAGFVEIDRSNPKKAYTALRQAGKDMVEHGLSLQIMPEGTRTLDGSLGPFKRGGFEIARITRLPILPVVIQGAIDIHRAHEGVVHKGRQAVVTIGEPIDPKAHKNTEELMQIVRAKMQAVLDSSGD